MTIELSLTSIPTSITQSQWDVFWNDSLRMFEKFPVSLVRLIDRQTNYGVIRLLSRNLVDSDSNGEYFTISGDASSLTTGEDLQIYRDFEYYRKEWNNSDTNLNDPLYCTSTDYDPEKQDKYPPIHGVKIFHIITHGHPYHYAVISIIAMGEYLLGGKCVGWEKLRHKESIAARHWLCDIFETDIPLPICLDASRLWNRIEGICGDIKLTRKRFKERFIGTRAKEVHRLLAESREITMRELAEELLEADNINDPFAISVSESFLEATDDLDMYLDLIDFRNSLAKARNNDDSSGSQYTIITLESVLQMLIMHHVTISKWQCEELHDFKRWMNMEGDSYFSANTSVIKALVPRKFDFYCSKTDLLETFIHRPSADPKSLKEAFESAFLEVEEQIERITKAVRKIKDEADRKYPPEKGGIDIKPTDNHPFTYVVQSEARVQSQLLEPMGNNDVINLAKKTCSFIANIRKYNFDVNIDEMLDDTSGELQKVAIANLIKDYALPMLEEVWDQLINTKDVKLLNFFVILITVSTSKEYNRLLPIAVQLVNQPNFWELFKKTILLASVKKSK
ncbi:MAG: hypothetical protein LBB88_01120 [Planctomycetaceae bacterium]|jgi:hypothetical protein|nr:hypothetical protein [Planctomycetaceae bacterium]